MWSIDFLLDMKKKHFLAIVDPRSKLFLSCLPSKETPYTEPRNSKQFPLRKALISQTLEQSKGIWQKKILLFVSNQITLSSPPQFIAFLWSLEKNCSTIMISQLFRCLEKQGFQTPPSLDATKANKERKDTHKHSSPHHLPSKTLPPPIAHKKRDPTIDNLSILPDSYP